MNCQAIGVSLTHPPIHSLTHSQTYSHFRVPGQEKGTSENEEPGFVGVYTLSLSHSHTLTRSRGQTYSPANLQLAHAYRRAHSPAQSLSSHSHTEWRASLSLANSHTLTLTPSFSHIKRGGHTHSLTRRSHTQSRGHTQSHLPPSPPNLNA